MAKKMKNAGKGEYLVTVVAPHAEVLSKKAKARVLEINEDSVIVSMRQPRSSKRVKRIIPRDEFTIFSYNEETGEVFFILQPKPKTILEVIGSIEITGGYVYVTEEDGTIHIFHEEDCLVEAEDRSKSKDEKDSKRGKKNKKRRQHDDDEDDESSEDEDDDSSEDEDEDEDERPRSKRRSRDDDDDSSEDEDEDEDDESSEDEDDESSEDDDDDSSEDEDEDEDEDERPRGKGRRGR